MKRKELNVLLTTDGVQKALIVVFTEGSIIVPVVFTEGSNSFSLLAGLNRTALGASRTSIPREAIVPDFSVANLKL